MFKRALVSVSQKEGLLEFLKPLVEEGLEIVSTGGTKEFLKNQGWKVTDISEVTQFPEVLDGRVKTLHPFVHMGLLARQDVKEHQNTLHEWKVKAFDLVIGNLYSFEEALKAGLSGMDLIEKIDIGGPSFLRSAAKNFASIAILCDPKDYQWVQEKNYALTLEDRKKLAASVFRLTSSYDQMIAGALNPEVNDLFPFAGRLKQTLRYGENEHQAAWWFSNMGSTTGLSALEQHQGKELSYNNLLDLDSSFSLCRQFSEPTVVAVKHNNPCGVASHSDPMTALQKAVSADPVSVFGGIIAVNFFVQKEQAQFLSNTFIECVLAPGYSKDALDVFAAKKNLRVLSLNPEQFKGSVKKSIRSLMGGFLLQEADMRFADANQWKVIGERPSFERTQSLLFGEKVCAALKSNAIAIVSGTQTVGLGMGQVNRVEAVQHAIERWQKHHPKTQDVVLISDAFFPFPDSIELCAKHGIRWILQPGGSIKDPAVIEKAQELNVNMVMTGIRHFRH